MMEPEVFVNCRFLEKEITGVQRYSLEITRELKTLYPAVTCLAPDQILHPDLCEELDAKVIGRHTGHLWEQLDLPVYLRSKGSPVLLNMGNSGPMFYGNSIVVIHDIAYERYPDAFSLQYRLLYRIMVPRLLRSAKAIVTVSEFSKSELVARFNLSPDDVSVVHNAVRGVFRNQTAESTERYILAVSSINRQKNFHSLIQAFNRLRDVEVKLYIVGGFNRIFTDPVLKAEVTGNPNIVFKGRVSDGELISLYSNALCFVFPSFYEGFGLPPIEAQSCGCPVVASNAASLPEICADSVVYCDPGSVDDIAQKISMLLEHDELRQELVRKGFANSRRFSWSRSAQKMYSIARAMIDENSGMVRS
ncbi:glycosyltransferase family 1 protein [Chlorobium sp. N1]|uniref:glycosyltransferase family 4 protein n=1 Tax=Chlorobium sp. N1 TaxID=2491138 RepID=UPI001039ECCD|nr:glycosyltransferase family 1 protein [Chlorobium sp. N1]TCD47274.1 glycosyltransferase family 1 protein [Chlorobium sp. N1]